MQLYEHNAALFSAPAAQFALFPPLKSVFWENDETKIKDGMTHDSRFSGCSSFRRPRFFRGVEGAELSSWSALSEPFWWEESEEESCPCRVPWVTPFSFSPLHSASFTPATPSFRDSQLSTCEILNFFCNFDFWLVLAHLLFSQGFFIFFYFNNTCIMVDFSNSLTNFPNRQTLSTERKFCA